MPIISFLNKEVSQCEAFITVAIMLIGELGRFAPQFSSRFYVLTYLT